MELQPFIQTPMKLGQKQLMDIFYQAYKWAVEHFTSRNFSFESDICRAFAGITSGLTLYLSLSPEITADFPPESLDFVVNLPMHDLIASLHWFPAREEQRRKPLPNNEFPSWSWAGWTGPMKYPHWIRPPITSAVLHAHVSHHGKRIRLLNPGGGPVLCDGETGMAHCWRNPLLDITMSDCAAQTIPSFAKNPVVLDLFAFHTPASNFKLEHQPPTPPPYDDRQLKKDIHICDANGRRCGSLASDTVFQIAEPKYHFVLLSFWMKDKYYRHGMDFGNLIWDSGAGYDILQYDKETLKETPLDRCLLCPLFYVILLVELHETHWERVAIGVIHPKAWHVVGKTFGHIILA
jgi:hypothetical protein